MIEEQVQPEGQQPEPPYRKKVYDLLSSNFSDFKRTEQEFNSKLDSDPEYYTKVHDLLSKNFTDFKRPKEEFKSMLGLKKKDAGASPTPSPSPSPSVGIPAAPSQPVSGLEQQIAQTRQNLSIGQPVTPQPLGSGTPSTPKSKATSTAVATPVKKQDQDGQGWFLNTVSALDRGFYKNLIGNPIKGLGTLLEGATAKVTGGSGKGFVSEALIKFGDYFNNAIDEVTPMDEKFKNTLTNQFAEAFGQVASIALTAGAGTIGKGAQGTAALMKGSAPAAAAKTAGTGAGARSAVQAAATKSAPAISAGRKLVSEMASPAAVSAGLSMGQAEFDRAKQAGASDDQAFEVFYKNAAVGSVLEKIPVMQFLKRFNRASAGGVANYLKTKGVAGLTGGFEEMTTEVLQQLYANSTAQDIYNVNQKLFEGVGESGGVGFGVGFLLNAMGANARILRNQGRDQEAQVVENQIGQLEQQAQNGGPSSYSVNGIKIKDPVVINDMIDNMTAADLTKANIEITNDPTLKQKFQDKIATSAIKEQVRESNPNLTEIQLDEVTNLEMELKRLASNMTQSGKDRAAAVRAQIKAIQEGKVPEGAFSNQGAVNEGNIGAGTQPSVEISSDPEANKADIERRTNTDGGKYVKYNPNDVLPLLKDFEPTNTLEVENYVTQAVPNDASVEAYKMVPTENVQPSENLSGKDRIEIDRIKDAIKNNEDIPPIVLEFAPVIDNNSGYKFGLADGHHRYIAYKELGYKEIPSAIITSREDYTFETNDKDVTTLFKKSTESAAPELSNIEIQPTVIVQNAAPFVNDVKVAAPEVETGSTMNIDGTQYTGGGLVVPAASMNTTIEEITPEMVAQFVEQNRGKISGENFKVGIYKFPNSNRASIDLNIVVPAANRAAALEFGRAAGQESLFDLDTFENVKTGADGVNPVSFTDEQFREIANALANNRVPNVFGQQEAMQAEQDVDTITRELLEELGLSNIDTIITNASQALADTGVAIDIVNDPVEYDNMVESMGGQRGTDGVFVAEDGKIILNNARLRSGIDAGRVIWHEASHPVMNIIRNTNRDLYDRAVRGAKEAAPEAFAWASENYDSQASIDDETLVEATSMVADGTIDLAKLPKGFRQTLIDFVNNVAKLLGFDPVLNDTDLGAFRKLAAEVSEALKSGRSIEGIVGAENVTRIENTIDEASIENTENEFSNSAVQARFTTEFFEDSDSFDKLVEDGDVVHNAEMSSFDDQTVVIHNPDSFATGKIKFRGKDLVEGEGGIYFVLKFGDVWASSKQSTARQMANLINESLKNSTDGKARVVLIKGDPNKNLTSVKGAKALMGVMEILADDGLIPLSAFRKALNAAGKKYGVDFDGRNDAKSIHRDIQSKFMNVSNSSFERRGDFVRDVIDEIANQNVLTKEDISRIAESIGATRKMTTFSKASIIDSVAYATTERVLRDVPNSHAYAVIETSSPVEIKQDGRHESYPWHIVTQDGSRPKLYLLKDRPYFNDAFVAAKDTEKVKAGEAFGDVSRAGLAQRGMGLAKVALGSRTEKALQARVSNKSPKKGVNLIEQAGYDLGLTEDNKGNYLFFHFSNKDLTKSGIDPSKHGASRQTSRQEAMQKPNVSYYYTTPSKESFTGDFGHVVAIPKHKVYPFQKDPLNLYDEAREAFLKDYPFGGFGPNQQIGWISKIAAKYGFEMVVGKWNGGMYRGETTIKHKPEFYSKPGLGINTTVFNPKYKDVVPNRKKKRKKAQARAAEEPQMSVGNRDNRVRAFIERKRSEGADDATIRQAIKNALNISDADIDAIMAAQQAPTGMELEEARLDVEGEGREMERGLARRFDTLPSETVARIDEDAKTYFQQTNRQTIEAVEEFMKGKNVEDVADYVVAGPQIPDASLVFMAAITAKKLTPMIEQARQDGNQDLAKRLADKQAAIYNTFAQKATSLGQAVQAFIAFKDDPNATQFYLNKILNQLREKGVEVTKDQEDQIRELLSDVGNAKNGLPKDMAIIKLSSYLNSISPVNGVEVLEAIWYAKILSGITTQSKNLFANLFNTFFEIPVVATRESIKNKSLMPFLYAAKGAVSGFAKGSVVGADILRTGVKEQDIDKYFGNNILEYFSWGRTKIGQLGGGRVGRVLDFPAFIELSPKALRFVGRGLSAADAMFSSINQEAYANMMAWAQAVNEGKNQPSKNDYKRANEILGNTKQVIEKAKQDAEAEGFKPGTLTFKRRVIELVEETRPEQIEQAAEDFGKRVTLNYEPEGFIRPIYNMIVRAQQEARLLKVWIPFTRIIANLTEQMLNYSPAGYYKAITGKRNPFGGGAKLTNEERGDLAIKATMGLAAVGVLASLVGDDEDDMFEITANGTGNVQKNYELEKEGWRPFTITLKDGTKINYADWPIRGILAGIGAYRDGVNYGDSDDGFWDRTTLFSYGMMASMYESSLMKGLAEFIDVFRPEQTGKAENIGEGISKWSAQQAKSVTLSNFTQQALKFVDEYQGDPIKEAKGAAILYRDIPVLNDGLNPIIDVFGDPVSPRTSEKLVPAYTVPNEKKDELITILHDKGIFVGVPKRPNVVNTEDNTEAPATDEQYYKYRKVYGETLKRELYERIDQLKDATPERASKIISAQRKKARNAAIKEL